MKKVYGYIRVSSIGQAMQGQSLEVQEDIIRKFFGYKLEPEGNEFAELIKDPAVSASTNLRDREGGEHLDRLLEKGDHVVFSKLDRGFRNTIDLLQTVRDWQRRGVVVHMLDIGVDLNSEMGQLLMGILGIFAEWERKRFTQRTLEGKARKKANGKTATQRYIGGLAAIPWGHKKVGEGKINSPTKIKCRIVIDKATRDMAKWFIACYERGWNVRQMWLYTLEQRITRKDRMGKKREWTPRSIAWAMRKELEMQKKEE